MTFLSPAFEIVKQVEPRSITSRITCVRGMVLRAADLPLPIGSLVRIDSAVGHIEPSFGEVVGYDADGTIIMLFTATRGFSSGDSVTGLETAQTVNLGPLVLGRVIDGLARPIDGKGPLPESEPCVLCPEPVAALHRTPIDAPLPTGICAIDSLLTAGKGQRLGIFAGPGVGKSMLLGAMARHTAADVSVIGLIGERGREVRQFIDTCLGPDGLARSVVVVATGDESPLLRVRASLVAMAAAEYFSRQGLDVLLLMDSLTRYCQAQRQIGLSVGEPPASRGYTPSVFSGMAGLLERAGRFDNRGSITGLYTVLVEGDDMTEPVSDASRAILDGHISLSRKLANRGHYPAIDVLDSVSRVADDVSDQAHSMARRQIRRALALYSEIEELLTIGAYVRGSNPEYDVAVDFKSRIDAFLTQSYDVGVPFEDMHRRLFDLAAAIGDAFAVATRSHAAQGRGTGSRAAPTVHAAARSAQGAGT